MTTNPSEEKIRVALLITQLGYGGAERSFVRLANYLSQSMQVQAVVFDAGSHYYTGQALTEPLKCPVVMLDSDAPGGKLRRWWQRYRKLRAIKREVDCCISFLSGPNVLNAVCGFAEKTIISIRGTRKYDANAANHHAWLYRWFLDPIVLRRVAHIVPVSHGLQHELVGLAGRSIIPKIRPITPFIIERDMQQRLQEALPEAFAGLVEQPVIVGIGRLSVEKNFQHLISIFYQVSKQVPGAKLCLIGNGPMEEALRQQCRQYHLAEDDMTPGVSSVIFAGYQPNPLPFLKLARIFALSSGAEGIPNVVLEALYAQTLVVAADATWGAREILEPEDELPPADPHPTRVPTPAQYGLLMPSTHDPVYYDVWAETLVSALTTQQWHQRYLPLSRARAMEFSLENVAPQWRELITRHYRHSHA